MEPQDISKWYKTKDEIGEIDLLWNSSPCQDFSIAGKQASGIEGSGTRSSLIYEVIRIVKEFMPKYIIWENVKGLTTKKHKPILDDYIQKLDDIGYNSTWQVLNAKDYGLAQNRERVFVVSIRKDLKQDFEFPNKSGITNTIEHFLQANDFVDDSYSNICPSMYKAIDEGKCRVIEKNGIASTITTKQQRWNNAGFAPNNSYYLTESNLKNLNRSFGSKGKLIQKDNISPTLTASMGTGGGNKPYIEDNKGLRYLTELECWRLMGFDDDDFYKAQSTGMSKSRLYKQAGNSVAVNVIEAIFDNLLKDYQ